jgi:hypothetical protein
MNWHFLSPNARQKDSTKLRRARISIEYDDGDCQAVVRVDGDAVHRTGWYSSERFPHLDAEKWCSHNGYEPHFL